MSEFLQSVITAFFLVTAVSVDSFVASLAYGAGRIRVPFCSVLMISAVCSAMLCAACFLGSIIYPYVPERLTKIICFIILFVLGVIKFGDSLIKAFIRKGKQGKRQLKFSIFSLKFILDVYADPEQADKDQSKVLTPAEAVSLAAALSIDGMAAGFGAALYSTNFWVLLCISFVIGMLSVSIGGWVGRRIGRVISFDLSWIGGILLITLAVFKLF